MAKVKEEKQVIVNKEYLEELLYFGEMSLEEIFLRVPFPRKSITSKLSLNPKFERCGKSKWRLKYP